MSQRKQVPADVQADSNRLMAAEKRLEASYLQHEDAIYLRDDGAAQIARLGAHAHLDELLNAKESMLIGIAKAAREGRLG